MTDRHGAIRLTRIAHVRGLRLARAAEDARLAVETATGALEDARTDHATAAKTLAEARIDFARTPACNQTQIWLDHKTADLCLAQTALSDCEANLNIAQSAHAEAVRAVARHQLRSDTIAAHHASLARADRRLAEERAELDAPAAVRVAAL